MKTNNEIFELAVTYLEFCGNDICMNSFNIWVTDQNLSPNDKRRVFMTALGLTINAI